MLDLNKIIHVRKLNKKELAEALFPEHNFPLKALNRIASGAAEFTAAEYRKLSEITGLPVGFLISDTWSLYASSPEAIDFVRSDVKATLDTKTWVTTVHAFKDGAYLPVFELKLQNAPVKVFMQQLVDAVLSNNVKHLNP